MGIEVLDPSSAIKGSAKAEGQETRSQGEGDAIRQPSELALTPAKRRRSIRATKLALPMSPGTPHLSTSRSRGGRTPWEHVSLGVLRRFTWNGRESWQSQNRADHSSTIEFI